MNETILDAAALIVPMVFAIVFHEVAHGLSAKWLGDPTAAERGRLSLNPIRHVDLIGTILVPGALALTGMPVFGWAKPVPVDARRMRNPRTGMMLSAAAGPASNFVQALVGAVLLGLVAPAAASKLPDLSAFSEALDHMPLLLGFFAKMLTYVLMINVFVGLFNLIPIPPFDGSHIVEGLLPDSLARLYARLRQSGMLIVILLIVVLPRLVPGFDPVGAIIDKPFSWLMQAYTAVISALAG